MDVKEAGRRGAKTRARNLTAKQRASIARKAAQARWAKVEKTRSKRNVIKSGARRTRGGK